MKEQEKISMKQIKIGTCVPGAKAEEWLKGFIGKGFVFAISVINILFFPCPE